MTSNNEVNIKKNYGTVNDNVTVNVFNYYENEFNSANIQTHYKLPFRYKLFTGRNNELEQIDKLVKESEVLIIRGMGGVGKSQIVKEYTLRSIEQFDMVIWINATNEAELNNEFRQIASYYRLNVNVKDSDISLVIETVRSYINGQQKSLIVFDGLDDLEPSMLKKFCPRQGSKVIVTTQNATYDEDIFHVLEINDLNIDDAIKLLLDNSNKRKKTDNDKVLACKLVRMMYYYPLAIEHARAYVNRNRVSLDEYILLYSEESVALFSNKLSEYELTALTSFKISFDKAIESEGYSYNLLGLSSLININEIPYKVLLDNDKYVDSCIFRKAIEALLSYSLIEIKGKYLSFHGIIQANMHRRLKEDGCYEQYIGEIYERMKEITPKVITNETDRDLTQDLLPHISYLAQIAINVPNFDEKALSLAVSIASILYQFGEFQSAIEFMKFAKMIAEECNMEMYIIDLLNSLGIAHHYIGKPEESFNYAFESKTILDAKVSEISTISWHSLNSSLHGNLGIMYKVRGELDDSLSCYQIALDSAEKVGNPEMIINQLNNIGVNYKHRGDYLKAIEYYDKAIGIKCNDIRVNQKAYSNKGVALRLLGDFDRARIVFEDAQRLAHKLGDLRTECISMFNLGICNFNCKDGEATLSVLKDALEIAEKIDLLTAKADILLWLGETFRVLYNDPQMSKFYYQQSYDLAFETQNIAVVNYISNMSFR